MENLIIPVVTSIVSAFVAWFFTRRKKEAEAESAELDNVEKATGIWRQMAQDMTEKVNELYANQQVILLEQQKLIRENSSLKSEIVKLEMKVNSLTRENKKLRELLENKEQ